MIGQRIKECRKAARMTQKELGLIVGKGESTVSEWEAEKRSPDVDLLVPIAKALHTTAAYLMGVEDYKKSEIFTPRNAISITRKRIPLIGAIHAGEPTFAEENFECYVEVGAEIHADYALRVKGDSMINARIEDGDIVFIRKQNTVNDGEIAAVLIDEDAALKRVRFLPGGTVAFMAENPRYQPIYVGGDDETRNIRILGKAVAFQSDVR